MTPLNPAITYEHALTLVFDTGTVPDGYSGDRASVSFAYEPHSKKILILCSSGYYGYHTSVLPLSTDLEEARWIIRNHPSAKHFAIN